MRLGRLTTSLLVLVPYVLLAVASPFLHTCLDEAHCALCPPAVYGIYHLGIDNRISPSTAPHAHQDCTACAWAQSSVSQAHIAFIPAAMNLVSSAAPTQVSRHQHSKTRLVFSRGPPLS